jgi:HEAT repeat protein
MSYEDLLENQNLPLKQQVELLGSPDRTVRRAAFNALEAQGQAILAAIIEGLQHPNPKIRGDCADLMDHLADDRCIAPLMAATQDDTPRVRRRAVHSLSCDRCKPLPLDVDLVPLFAEILINDDNAKVRHEAAYGLALRAPDARMVPALEQVRDELTAKPSLPTPERVLLRNVKLALKRQHLKPDRVCHVQK